MPLHYLDSSALVKRYVAEAGSSRIALLCRDNPVAISVVGVTETASALARRVREGALTTEQGDTLFRLCLRDTLSFLVVNTNPAIAKRAAALLLSAPPGCRLRSLDALHVASALEAFRRGRRRGLETGVFVTADRPLLSAASWAGLDVLNPEEESAAT